MPKYTCACIDEPRRIKDLPFTERAQAASFHSSKGGGLSVTRKANIDEKQESDLRLA